MSHESNAGPAWQLLADGAWACIMAQVRQVARALLLSEATLDAAALLRQAEAPPAVTTVAQPARASETPAGSLHTGAGAPPWPSAGLASHAYEQPESWAAALAGGGRDLDGLDGQMNAMPASAPASQPPTIVAGGRRPTSSDLPPSLAAAPPGASPPRPPLSSSAGHISGYFRALGAAGFGRGKN